MPEKTVLDELVFVGRCGPADHAVERPLAVPVLADPEPAEPPLTLRQQISRFLALSLIAATIILVIGLAMGYAS